ncbi:MAG: Crp/Fnr family transcriptional regulator [Candidatus Protistobacter heckmanni]|nr:Crp/Fnr family transcriptional regulator [Candidatus Protistobacter heckmanni]
MPKPFLEMLTPQMELVELKNGDVLPGLDARGQYIYFPISAVMAVIYILSGGSSLQVAYVANDGMAGHEFLMGENHSANRLLVLKPGYAYRLRMDTARGLFELGGHFQLIILRFSHLLTRRISQSAACYRYHSVEQLFCRWLLTYVDKAGENQIRITHEVISHLLGVRRESITELLGKLQKAGLVASGRARLEVRDRAALEARCCECYSTVKRDIEAILPPVPPPLMPAVQYVAPRSAVD